jgi:hypothetical protein
LGFARSVSRRKREGDWTREDTVRQDAGDSGRRQKETMANCIICHSMSFVVNSLCINCAAIYVTVEDISTELKQHGLSVEVTDFVPRIGMVVMDPNETWCRFLARALGWAKRNNVKNGKEG